MLYRAGSDDRAFGNRTQKDSPIAVYGFRVVDVRQARIDEVPYKRIRVSMKVLMPNGFNKPPSRRCVAESEGPNCPIWLEAREVRHWYVALSVPSWTRDIRASERRPKGPKVRD